MSFQRVHKCPWSNKFHEPTMAQLREGYARPEASVFEETRRAVLGLVGVSEVTTWHGVPWRWTLVYRCRAEDSAAVTRAFAYIIPDPARLQVCIPLTSEQIAALPIRRFKKHLRDQIVHARTVGGLSWPSWDVPTRGALEDLSDLLRRKHRLVGAADERALMSA